MIIYGIPTCDTVRNARKFFKDNEIDVEFVNFKKTSVEYERVDTWIKGSDINVLFNNKGKKYRDLKLKELNLDEAGKREWLCKENMLFKRPVIEYKDQIIVGWDEDKYKEIFCV